MPIDGTEVVKAVSRYDGSTAVTLVILLLIGAGVYGWFKYVYLPWQSCLREDTVQRTKTNDLMAQTLSALSEVIKETHQTVNDSHIRIERINFEVCRLMAGKVIEAEMIGILADKTQVDLRTQLGKLQGILHDYPRDVSSRQ